MGSTSGESRTPDRTTTTDTTATGLGRRDLIKRSAALGLIAVPTMSFLSACASSGGGDEDKAEKGKKTAKNPLAVNDSAAAGVRASSTAASARSTPRTPSQDLRAELPEGEGQVLRRPRRSSRRSSPASTAAPRRT